MEKTNELSPYEKIIRQRINQLINKYCDGNQQRFVERTGLNKGSVSTYVNGKNTPSRESAEKIAAAFDIDVEWLLGYDVIPDGLTDEEVDAREKKAMELLNLYEALDPDIQDAVMLLLKAPRRKP